MSSDIVPAVLSGRARHSHALPRIVVAHPASAAMLGQREYESRLITALAGQDSLAVKAVAFQSLRGRSGGRRVPLGALTSRPVAVQRALSRFVYGTPDLVHRLDAKLPVAQDEILTLHDLAPLRFDDEGVWPQRATASALLARAVLAPSEFAATEIRTVLGVSHVTAIPNGVDAACYSAGPLRVEDRRSIQNLPERYVVYAGGSSARKNLPALAAAWRRVCDQRSDAVELVVCGPASPEKTRLFTMVPHCRIVGQLERGLLLRLITSAAVVVTPSLYEGFGLPVLEAMAAGTTVVSARTSSLVEVAGDSGILVDPTPEGIAAGLTEALAGENERRIEAGRRWSRRFDWDTTAARHAELYLSLLGR